LFLIVLILLVRLQRMVHIPGSLHQKNRLVVCKEYRYILYTGHHVRGAKANHDGLRAFDRSAQQEG